MQTKDKSGEGDSKLLENTYDTDRNNLGNEESLLKDTHLSKNPSIGSPIIYRNNTLIWVNISFNYMNYLFYYYYSYSYLYFYSYVKI